MSDELLRHYEKELEFIREESKHFSKNYPKIASRLKLGEDELKDPLIEHLISAFSFLNARVQHRLDDDFPEFSQAILEVLYPHYLRPIPPCTIVHFDTAYLSDEPQSIAKATHFETNEFVGKRANLQTTNDVPLLPLSVSKSKIMFRPCTAPASNEVKGNAIIQINIDANDSIASIQDLAMSQLRFYLGGQDNHRHLLYELIFNQLTAVVIAENEEDQNPVILPADIISDLGFNEDEALLPYPSNSLQGYQLLTEFFVFQDKFLFFDVNLPDEASARISGKSFQLYFYLSDAPGELEHDLKNDNFLLSCCPAINLFKQVADPIRMDYAQDDYLLSPDVTQHDNMEVYSIDKVDIIDTQGNVSPLDNYYASRAVNFDDTKHLYWLARRVFVLEGDHHKEKASNIRLSFIDTQLSTQTRNDNVISVETTCLNRNSISKLPFDRGLSLQALSGGVPSLPIKAIVPPTPTLRIQNTKDSYWKLISHLNLNHLSLSNGDESLSTLKDILSLYDFRDTSSTKSLIDSICRLETKPASATIPIDNMFVPVRGLEIILTFDPLKLGGQSPYLFAKVLEVFFGLYCNINSFVRTGYRLKGREELEKIWPPRNGEQPLI